VRKKSRERPGIRKGQLGTVGTSFLWWK